MHSTGGVLSNPASINSFHPAIKILARIVSYVFHPLFIPIYVAWFILYEIRLFPDRSDWQKTVVMIQFVLYYTFLPMMTTLISKALGFVSSIQLKSQKDRILPYVICEIFYFWAWYVFRNLQFPRLVVLFGLAVFVACSLGLILNSYLKISMHAISVGVLTAFMLFGGYMTNISFGMYISVAIFITGLTCTARMIDSDHTTKEIYSGLLVGMLAVAGSYFFI
jgi:hypothetical protein